MQCILLILDQHAVARASFISCCLYDETIESKDRASQMKKKKKNNTKQTQWYCALEFRIFTVQSLMVETMASQAAYFCVDAIEISNEFLQAYNKHVLEWQIWTMNVVNMNYREMFGVCVWVREIGRNWIEWIVIIKRNPFVCVVCYVIFFEQFFIPVFIAIDSHNSHSTTNFYTFWFTHFCRSFLFKAIREPHTHTHKFVVENELVWTVHLCECARARQCISLRMWPSEYDEKIFSHTHTHTNILI